MAFSGMFTDIVSWMTNINVFHVNDHYSYGTVKGTTWEFYYQIPGNEEQLFVGISYIVLSMLCIIPPVSFIYFVYVFLSKPRMINYKMIAYWIPLYIMIIMLKFDTTYTIIKLFM